MAGPIASGMPLAQSCRRGAEKFEEGRKSRVIAQSGFGRRTKSTFEASMEKNGNCSGVLAYRDERRKRLLYGLDITSGTGIEIGPLCWPLVRREDGAKVIYIDHTDTPGLRDKYRGDPVINVEEIVDIDAVWGKNTLHEAVGGKYFDYVVASHVVEHVPDLVTWLRELAAVLKPTGEVRLAVPDRRFTFDYFRRESRLQEVLLSYIARARVPHPYSLLDYCLSVADVSTIDAWRGRIDPRYLKRHHTWEGAVHLARDSFENGTYHDVHCWVFTPATFAKLLSNLCQIGLLDFACEDFCDTRRNELEFFVTLRRSNDKEYIAQSWLRMEHAASNATPGVPLWRLRRGLERLHARWTSNGFRVRSSGQSSDLDATVPIALPPNFNPTEYLRANPDVRDAGADPTIHYKHYGWCEGRPVRLL